MVFDPAAAPRAGRIEVTYVGQLGAGSVSLRRLQLGSGFGLVLLLGCAGREHSDTGAAVSDASTGPAATGTDASVGSSAGSESQGASTSAGVETADSSSGSAEESTTGGLIQLCGLEDLKPGAPNPIVSGSGPMEIPPDIATILFDNCGCHYADMLAVGPPIADYSDSLPLKIDTWAQWHSDYGLITKQPTIDSVLERVRDSPIQFTMPHKSCHVGGGEHMVPEQRQILIDWLVAGAPDGATWVPP